jgi:hypothetical protein
LLARIMWRRLRAKAPIIPKGYPLQSFYQFSTFGLDVLCYTHATDQAVKIANNRFENGEVLQIHPIWLFQRGEINRRGPFYEALSRILDVDKELRYIAFRRRFFFRIAMDSKEYERDVVLTEGLLGKLREKNTDILTLIERKWCCSVPHPIGPWIRTVDNVALLHVTAYDEWLKNVGKKTRNMIRKAEKSGVETLEVEPDEKLAKGIWKIYNETPVRQERGFPHYGTPLNAVKESLLSSENCTCIGAYLGDELAGFLQLTHGDNVTVVSQILSLQKHWDKAVNNALVAKAVETSSRKGIEWLMYGRIGNHPTLDTFKKNNGFVKFEVPRFYILMTRKGKIAAKLGLHKELKDALPQPVKYRLIPFYNWVSRTRMRIKTHFSSKLTN